MNVLVIGKFYAEGFALHIAETLELMGHSVARFEPGIRSRSRRNFVVRLNQVRGAIYAATDGLPLIRAGRLKRLWQVAESQPLDIVIVCHDFLWPNEVSELKRLTRASVCLWFPDSIAGFGRGYFMVAPYDALFLKDPYQIFRLQGVVSSPVFYLPECFSPERHVLNEPLTEKDLETYQCEICTAGNFHAYRAAFFNRLSHYDIKIWGNAPPLWMPKMAVTAKHGGKFVEFSEKAKAFRAAKIVVNNLLYGEIWGVNARTFEVAGVGAFQLVDWRPGLDQLFRDGVELVSFRGMEDLIQKIDYWLPRDTERREISAAGMIRAGADHTYRHRLEILLTTLAGSANGMPLPIRQEWAN